MKKFLFLVLIFNAWISSYCQTNEFEEYVKQLNEEFNNYKEDLQNEFFKYQNNLNEQFSNYMRELWHEFSQEEAIKPPLRPEPPEPTIDDHIDYGPGERQMVIDITTKVEPIFKPKPVLPAKDPFEHMDNHLVSNTQILSFNLYGKLCEVPFDNELNISLNHVTENDVADAWTKLSVPSSFQLLRSCLQYKNELNLPDWGYLSFLDQLAQAAFPNKTNEGTLLKIYLLTQSGYKVRIGKSNSKLLLFLPSKNLLYNYKYVRINNENYYIYDKNYTGNGMIQIFDRSFPNEQGFSLQMDNLPCLPLSPTNKITIKSKTDSNINIDIILNQNLIDFYNDYPLHSEWQIDVYASLSTDVKLQLYPKLVLALKGKSTVEAANILLHLVQTGFEYQTDEEQFGYERPLFPDETIYYPYSDCEDRAIFFAVLIRELLGLDIVFLNYPEHLATAVCFDIPVDGDYIMIDGKKYIVCDPTYINANIGRMMPQFKGVGAQIIKI